MIAQSLKTRVKSQFIGIKELFLVFCHAYSRRSFSQEGEDLILDRFFGQSKKAGFYVDVGAHHPVRFSNTYLFYRQGWRGVNIDALPRSMALFDKLRPRDINLECAISDTVGDLPYFMFREPALNTFSEELADEYINNNQAFLRKELLPLSPLAEILAQYLEPGARIDFMSVDAEGLDMKVLMSNDWNKFRPEVVLVESLGFDLTAPEGHEVNQFMTGQGYSLFAKTINTLFFQRKN